MGKILRIRGYLEHNEACKEAVTTRIPKLPIHPSVYAKAMAQLHEGVPLHIIQATNREMFRVGAYPEQPNDLQGSNYRWILKWYDTRTLYRCYNQSIGVNTNHAAHLNIDNWLNPSSKEYNAVLANAIFYYSA